MQLSVAMRNAGLDAYETQGGTSAVLKIYNGPMPANCAAAESGTTILCSMSLPSDWMASASSGAKAKTGTWSGVASASGYADHWRLFASDGTTVLAQGLCSQAWAASTPVVVGEYVTNGGNVYKCTTAGTTNSSGGPTGTGTGITDGTAVFDYVGLSDMSLDNSNVNSGQTLTVNTFTLTAGNP